MARTQQAAIIRYTKPLYILTVAVYMPFANTAPSTLHDAATAPIPANKAPCFSAGVILDIKPLMSGTGIIDPAPTSATETYA